MTIVSIFFIVLIAAFAVLALLIEPSKTDKLIHSRLVSLDRSTRFSVRQRRAKHRKRGHFQHRPRV